MDTNNKNINLWQWSINYYGAYYVFVASHKQLWIFFFSFVIDLAKADSSSFSLEIWFDFDEIQEAWMTIVIRQRHSWKRKLPFLFLVSKFGRSCFYYYLQDVWHKPKWKCDGDFSADMYQVSIATHFKYFYFTAHLHKTILQGMVHLVPLNYSFQVICIGKIRDMSRSPKNTNTNYYFLILWMNSSKVPFNSIIIIITISYPLPTW